MPLLICLRSTRLMYLARRRPSLMSQWALRSFPEAWISRILLPTRPSEKLLDVALSLGNRCLKEDYAPCPGLTGCSVRRGRVCRRVAGAGPGRRAGRAGCPIASPAMTATDAQTGTGQSL